VSQTTSLLSKLSLALYVVARLLWTLIISALEVLAVLIACAIFLHFVGDIIMKFIK
jgi:hypothetical protein